MNKVMLAVVAVIILLLVGGVGVFFMMKKTSIPTNTSQTTTPQVSPKNQIEKKSLKDLMNISTNQTCTFHDATTGNSGVVYASNGKMRGDFTTVVNNISMSSHMISDGTNMYTWIEGEKKGLQMSLESIEQFKDQGVSSTQSSNMDIDRQLDYECSNWSVDNSVFVLPSTVEFQDYSFMMEGMRVPSVTGASEGTDMRAIQCASCEKLSGDAKAQCLAVLKC